LLQIKDLDPVQAGRVAALLDEALDLPPEARTDWQSKLEQSEPQLASVVADLLGVLASHDDVQVETHDLIAKRIARATETPLALEGRMFGPYRVLRLLGSGGMGTVWLAQRSDGLFARQVALKLVHANLSGPSLTERFARERSILATLNHPHIARLLDAGVTDEGQHYLAIEYIEGIPLTTYCDQHCLPIEERVELMLQVLSAVRHAHQNLTVHRDLKPSNILVTAEGHVRLLDFGIAKLLTEGAAHETELTLLGGRALTPEYASPEQIAGQPVSTASDVYSTGVLLYHVLTGRRPYQLTRDSRAALEDAILSVDPLRPSQQSFTPEVAAARSTTVKRLKHALAGDLDTIALKALKKKPAERYATADAFMQDLQRYRYGMPVLARRDSAAYRARKFITRNKGKVAIAAAVSIALLGATVVSIRQANIARGQAALAQRETQRAQAVQQFLLDIFRTNSNSQPDPVRARQTTARELLDAGARSVSKSLHDAPEAQAEVLDTLADMYYQLGLFEEAGDMRQRRVQLLKQTYGPQDLRVANALLNYAKDVANSNERTQADAALTEARAILAASKDSSSNEFGMALLTSVGIQQYISIPQMQRDAAQALQFYRSNPYPWGLFDALQASGRACYLAGKYACAEKFHRDALTEASFQTQDPAPWLITPLVQLAEAESNAFDLQNAEQHYREALTLSRKINGDLSGITLQTQAKLGSFLHQTGRRVEGTAVMQDALAKIVSPQANATPDAVSAVNVCQGMARMAEGRLSEVESLFNAELTDLREHYADSIPLARALLLQASLYTALGRYDAGAQMLDEAQSIWKRTGGDAVLAYTGNRFLLAQAYLLLAQGHATQALARLQATADRPDESQLPFRYDAVVKNVGLAQTYLQLDRAPEAERAARRALNDIQHSPLREHYPTLEADAALRLGQALERAGDASQARANIEHAVQLRETNDAPASPWLAEARIALANCLIDGGEMKGARMLLAQAASAQAAQAELGEHFKAPLRALQARMSGRPVT
jgi:serine/threonine protein kinase